MIKCHLGGGTILYPNIKDKKTFKEYQKTNPDFIIPLMYDVIGRNILKNNKKLLLLIINNVLNTSFKLEDITIKDGRVKKEWKKEKGRECDILVEIGRNVINIEINKKHTSVKDKKNMSYVGNLYNNYYDYEICQININDYDIFNEGEEIYVSMIKEMKKGFERIENLKIYDVNIGKFKEKCYTNSRRYDKDFITLMKIFESKSRKEIEKEIKDSILLKEVYEMQDKLNREDFVLERFPDDLLHELEKKEIKEEGIKEGIKKRNKELINSMIKKGMSKEEIADLLNCNIDHVNIYNSKNEE